jgi:hypothetical protein
MITRSRNYYYTLLFPFQIGCPPNAALHSQHVYTMHARTNTSTDSFKLGAGNLEVPSIDLQEAAASVVGDWSANTDGDYVVEPGIGRATCYVFEAQMQLAGGRGGALRPHVDVCTVLGQEAVPRIWVKGARSRAENAPVGSEVEDCACEQR